MRSLETLIELPEVKRVVKMLDGGTLGSYDAGCVLRGLQMDGKIDAEELVGLVEALELEEALDEVVGGIVEQPEDEA